MLDILTFGIRFTFPALFLSIGLDRAFLQAMLGHVIVLLRRLFSVILVWVKRRSARNVGDLLAQRVPRCMKLDRLMDLYAIV